MKVPGSRGSLSKEQDAQGVGYLQGTTDSAWVVSDGRTPGGQTKEAGRDPILNGFLSHIREFKLHFMAQGE